MPQFSLLDMPMDGFDVGHYYYLEGSLVSYLHMDLAVGFLFSFNLVAQAL